MCATFRAYREGGQEVIFQELGSPPPKVSTVGRSPDRGSGEAGIAHCLDVSGGLGTQA